MIKVSTLALSAGFAALALSASAGAQQKAQPLRMTPAVLKAAQQADAALTRGDTAAAEPLVTQAEAAAVSDQDRYFAAVLRYRAESAAVLARQAANPSAASNPAGLARALDALIANPLTPAVDRGRYAYQRAELAYAGRQYKVAADLFTRAGELGYRGPDQGLSAVAARVEGGDTAGGTAELDRVIAAQTATGQPASPEYYRYAIGRLNKTGATAQTVAWMNRFAAAHPSPKTWYEVLATYGVQQGATATLDDRQKLDVFRLMRATNAMPSEYFHAQYAQTAQRAGLPQEAQAVLKDGIAAGKLSATNPEVKAMLTAAGRPSTAKTAVPSEAKANAATTGVLAAQAADAQLAAGNDAKAATLYRTALTKGGVDANAVNLHLGIALARSGDKAGAQTALAAVTGSPHAEIASFWRTWIGTPAA